ncbi:MAG: SMC-Scp complex subunit ScpB [Phycisphaerales bacterium]|nr:MAG: SMC-Scp complex subunit ScpB [Phycisphaerales bacterium]
MSKRAHTEVESDAGFLASVEAVIVSADRPVTPGAIGEALLGLGKGDTPSASGEDDAEGRAKGVEARVRGAVEALNEAYDQSGRAFRIEQVAGGWRLMTRPEHAEVVAAFSRQRQSQKLSRAAIETLAIIAYRQPMTRASLEAIRGVACGEVLRSLLERKMVMIKGRAEELGRPMLYGTTKQFLDAFGLATLRDLPKVGELVGGAPPARDKATSEASGEGFDAEREDGDVAGSIEDGSQDVAAVSAQEGAERAG